MKHQHSERRACLQKLRTAYDDAFRTYREETRRFVSIQAQAAADGSDVRDASRRLEQTTAAYRKNRNRLTQFLIYGSAE